MTDAERSSGIERILVALDTSPHSLAALEAAIKLAERIEAELVGIFVEDVNLIRLSELPFTQEIGLYSARMHQVDTQLMESQLRSQARRARRALRVGAESAHLQWSFRVTRGAIPAELLAAALETDLIILGKAGWSTRNRLGSTARVLVVEGPGYTMVSQKGVRLEQPIMVLYDGSPAGEKALTAAQLVHTGELPLIVLLVSDERAGANELQTQVRDWAQRREIELRLLWIVELDGQKMASLARLESCGVLVMPAQSAGLNSEDLVALVNECGCAVLLAR